MASSADSSVVPCKKRVCGDLLLLSDVTNAPASKRTSSANTTEKIKELNSSGAPTGRHVSMSPPPSSFPDSLQQILKDGCTLPTQFFVDGCYARLLLLYTYRGFSTTTQGQSTC